MSKNTKNTAVKIAKEIALGLKSTNDPIEFDNLIAFYRAALHECYNVHNLTKEEYNDLVDIMLILASIKETHIEQ